MDAAERVLSGERRGVRAILPFLGPAFIAAVAYVDPGNFATNMAGGSQFGYMLLWVVVAANLVAMLFQALSARLGIVTGHSLAGLSRLYFPRPVSLAKRVDSEIAAMATDLAESLGAAIGLSLLCHIPLLIGLLITFAVTLAILLLQRRGFRPIELVISGFIGLISICYLIELAIAPPDWAAFGFHAVVPQLDGPDSVMLSVGIIGAPVMPHAIYLHSSLTQGRTPAFNDAERRRILSFSNREVLIALSIAGLVNMAMLAMAANAFHAGHPEVAEIETAYHTLTPLLGIGAAAVFLISLLASGLASSVVGTMAGQVIMQDFVDFRIPLWGRRLVTMLPAVAVVAWGVNATQALVASQVVLSLVLPVPMIALLILLFRRDIMGSFRPGPVTRAASVIGTVVVLGLNLVLLAQTTGM